MQWRRCMRLPRPCAHSNAVMSPSLQLNCEVALAFAACPPSGWHVARVTLTKIKHGQTLSCMFKECDTLLIGEGIFS